MYKNEGHRNSAMGTEGRCLRGSSRKHGHKRSTLTGSQRIHSHGIQARCDSAQLPQWMEPVALGAILTHSCWTQINLTDHLTNKRVRVETPLGKDIVGGLPFSGNKMLPTWIRGSERIIDVKQRTEPEYRPVWMQEVLLPEKVPWSTGRTESTSKRKASAEMWFFSPARHETGSYFSIPHIWTDYIICTETGGGQTSRCPTCFHLFSCHTAATTWKTQASWMVVTPKLKPSPALDTWLGPS